MQRNGLKVFLVTVLVVVVILVGITLVRSWQGDDQPSVSRASAGRIIPVEVAEVRHGTIDRQRVFSGTLTPSAELRVAPKISGRIRRLLVDISDPVKRGEVVTELDDEEFAQAVSSAQADLVVAKAQAAEAHNRLELAQRELERAETLEARGVASAAALDAARNEFIMRQSAADVADANVLAREAALATAEIRLGYTRVNATWSEGDEKRYVAERFADEGDTVAANTPLLSVVSLSPIRTVFHVPERDYASLRIGQPVTLRTDAFPGETFPGVISRIAPVFREDSRQARVEVRSDNEDKRLRPGMFVRATVVLDSQEDILIVPLDAVTRRDGREGLFLVNEEEGQVSWIPIETGLQSTTHIAVSSPDFKGKVVVLGLQFLSDGAPVHIIQSQRD